MAAAGLLGDVRGIASGGVRMLRTRLELLSIEVQQEKAKVARQLVVASATIFFLSFGMMLAILWIVVFLPEGLRAPVLGILCLGFLVAGAVGAWWLREPASEPPFSGTLAVLRADEQALAGGHDD